MKRPAAQTAAAAVVLAVLGAVAIFTAHPAAPDAGRFSSTDYGPDGYRAWSALLTREGISAERFRLRPIELDRRIDTLISAQPAAAGDDPSARTPADLAALAAWVRGGGRLVYAGRNARLSAGEDQLLHLPYFLPDVGSRAGLNGPLAAAVGSLAAAGTNRMLLVEHAGRAELADANGDIVVRYALGRGEILAAVDGVPFTNAHLTAGGNARLAYLLGRPGRPGGIVAFDDAIHGALVDRPWYRALPVAVLVGLSIVAVAGVLALAGSALPGAPPVRLEPPREPTSGEYVAALAALYERIEARSAAAATLAADALHCAARGNGLTDAAVAADIAARIGPGPAGDDVRQLGQTLIQPPATDAEFVASARLAQRVRREWSHDGFGDRGRAAFTGRPRTRRRR